MRPVYLASDVVRPRRPMILREGIDGVAHWANREENESPHAVSYCGATLRVFFRGRDPEHPTCLRCIGEITLDTVT